jgi:hypothetical protein
MRNRTLMPKLGKDAAALGVNGLGDGFPASPLLAIVNSRCAELTLAIFADPGAFADDQAGRRALLIVLAHQVIGHMPGIACSPTGEGSHHDSVG